MSLRRNSSAFSSYVALTKPRITLFVVMTAFVGFVAGTKGPLSGMDLGLLFHTLLGTALVASGTSAFNQVWEKELDGRMQRTAARPLPLGPPAAGRSGALRRRAVGRRPRRAPPLHERDHDRARGFHARLLRLRVHADEDALAGLHDRRRDPRRAAAARRVRGRGGRPRPARTRALRDPLRLAAAALFRDRLAPPRRLFEGGRRHSARHRPDGA